MIVVKVQIRIFEYDSAENGWEQRGNDIDGEFAGDLAGESVSLSADGSVVAIGAPYHDGVINTNRGQVRIFEYGFNCRKMAAGST